MTEVAGAVTTPTVRGDDSLADVIATMAAGGERLVVVLGPDGRVRGVVADADIRRAVLRGSELSSRVGDIVTSAPVFAGPDDADETVRRLLADHRLPAVAVVDDAGRLVGTRRLADLDRDATVAPVGVLMVGGRGERLRPLTDKLPKPLLRIGGAAIVERLISSFHAAGVREVYLTVNYMAEEFEERLGDGADLGVRLHYVREDQPMGTAGALALLPSQERPVLVSNGDLVTTVDFGAMVEFHRVHDAVVTVAGVEYTATVPYGVLRTADHHLLHIDEKPTARHLVSAGMYVLSPQVLRYVPGDRPFTMPDLIDAVLRDGHGVAVFPVLERWSDIGSKDEFERVLYEFAVDEET
jgi:dTDP-glucose pyrophosphorylase